MTKVNANSLELLKQSEEIRKQSEALKKKEAPDVLARIKLAVAHYGFTAAELGLAVGKPGAKAAKSAKAAGASGPKAAKARAKPKAAGGIKFRDNQGHAWSGFGRKPKWFLAALAAGATVDSLKA